jgi:hypothetical protein
MMTTDVREVRHFHLFGAIGDPFGQVVKCYLPLCLPAPFSAMLFCEKVRVFFDKGMHVFGDRFMALLRKIAGLL